MPHKNTILTLWLQVGTTPTGVEFNPANGNMYVSNLRSASLTEIDGDSNTILGNPISVGSGPWGLDFLPLDSH
jgi:DNA-binding beta-propeller fold protein YncE